MSLFTISHSKHNLQTMLDGTTVPVEVLLQSFMHYENEPNKFINDVNHRIVSIPISDPDFLSPSTMNELESNPEFQEAVYKNQQLIRDNLFGDYYGDETPVLSENEAIQQSTFMEHFQYLLSLENEPHNQYRQDIMNTYMMFMIDCANYLCVVNTSEIPDDVVRILDKYKMVQVPVSQIRDTAGKVRIKVTGILRNVYDTGWYDIYDQNSCLCSFTNCACAWVGGQMKLTNNIPTENYHYLDKNLITFAPSEELSSFMAMTFEEDKSDAEIENMFNKLVDQMIAETQVLLEARGFYEESTRSACYYLNALSRMDFNRYRLKTVSEHIK